MPDVLRVRENLTKEFDTLEFEVAKLVETFKATNFFGHQSNFPHAHYGYLTVCMGKIDLLSSFWTGKVGQGSDQTKRMIAFMERHLHPGKTAEHRVAVQMFRHTLMHTGALRFLYNKNTDIRYTWRVFFGEGLSPGEHYTTTTHDPQYQDQLMALGVSTGSTTPRVDSLNVSIELFAADVKRAITAYLDDLAADPQLQANYDLAHPKIIIQEF